MALLNDFKLGADPEFALCNGDHILMFKAGLALANRPWGIDHVGWVIEPHPKPELSVRSLLQNLKVSLNDFATVAPECTKWRAGAYLDSPEREVTLGGHVHIDRPNYTAAIKDGLDLFTSCLEALDILPKDECTKRRGTGHYGKLGDFRVEHGHYEYRSMASWLFSQRVTKLCLIGSKLIVVDPKAPTETLEDPRTVSVTKLKKFFERFKGKDDDVDWILDGRMLERKLNVKPDRDLRDVWAVKPEKEAVSWKAEAKRNAINQAAQRLNAPVGNEGDRFPFYYLHGGHILGATRPLDFLERNRLPETGAGELTAIDGGGFITKIASARRGWCVPDDQLDVIETNRYGQVVRLKIHRDTARTERFMGYVRRAIDAGFNTPGRRVQFIGAWPMEFI